MDVLQWNHCGSMGAVIVERLSSLRVVAPSVHFVKGEALLQCKGKRSSIPPRRVVVDQTLSLIYLFSTGHVIVDW